MKIVFLSPPNKIDPEYDHFRCCPQAAAASLGAVLLPNHDYQYIDLAPRIPPLQVAGKYLKEDNFQFNDRVKKIVGKCVPEANLYMVSSLYTYQWPQVRYLIHLLKSRFPEAKILLGGRHSTGDAHRALTESGADAVVLGAAEDLLPNIISELENSGSVRPAPHLLLPGNNSFNKNASMALMPDPSNLPRPRYEVFDQSLYNYDNFHTGALHGTAAVDIFTSHGCSGVCRFCTTPTMAPSWQPRLIEALSEDLDVLRSLGYDEIILEDDNILINKKRAFRIFKLLDERGFIWSLFGGIERIHFSQDVAEALLEYKCWRVHLSVESCNVDVLSSQGKWKGSNKTTLKINEEAIKSLAIAGVEIFLDFVIGFPQQSISSMWESAVFGKKLVNECGASMALFHCATPFPGTPFYFESIRNGYLKNPLDYTRYTFTKGSFSCAEFEADDLTNLRIQLLRHANGHEIMEKDRERLQRPDPQTINNKLSSNLSYRSMPIENI